jgi:cytoskeleton protein RodZ
MTERIASTGPRLKAERERRGLSSQKAADELHLDGWVIDALEAENYDRIGPSVYAKGHLKRYASLLGLPADEIMAGYESREQAPKAEPVQTPNVRLRTDAPEASDLPWPRIAGSVALLLLILAVLWWKPWHQRSTAPATDSSLAANPSTAPASGAAESSAAGAPPDASPATSGLMPTSLASSPAVAPNPAAVPAAGGGTALGAGADAEATAGMGRARLRMSFSADSWVDIHDAAGRRVFAGNGRANSVKTVAGIAPMRVYLGLASGVQLEINDRAVAIGPQFMAGDVARFVAGADGVLRRDSRSAAAVAGTPAALARPSD